MKVKTVKPDIIVDAKLNRIIRVKNNVLSPKASAKTFVRKVSKKINGNLPGQTSLNRPTARIVPRSSINISKELKQKGVGDRLLIRKQVVLASNKKK
jgi:L-amino acid N-acyltransferase YncA